MKKPAIRAPKPPRFSRSNECPAATDKARTKRIVFFAPFFASCSMKFAIALALQLFVGVMSRDEGEANWNAGCAVVKITPETPIPMSGYDSRKKPFEEVEQDIFAKALAVEDSLGHRAVLLTIDLIGHSRALAEPVCARIVEKNGIRRADVLLNFAHIHSGPRLSDEEPVGIAPEDVGNIATYTR